jgi:hypothetical protein
MRLTTLAAAVCVTVGIAACGASNSSDNGVSNPEPATVTQPATVATTPTQTDTATLSTTTTTTTATRATTPTTPATVTTATITRPDSGGAGLTTTASVSAAACVAADLTPVAAPPNGATGTVVLGFILKNTSPQACSTYGWPGIAFVDSAGDPVATQTTRTTSDILGSTPPRTFSIAAGGEASFRVTVHDSNDQGGESGCGSYATVQIIAPNDTATMRVKLPDGPAEVCGAAAVSPLEPGTSATGQ